MAKLTVVSTLLLVALLTIASATAHRTTITTTVVEEAEENQQSRGCQKRIQKQQQQLRHCQQFMSPMSPFELNMYPQQGQQEQHRRPCCQAIENIEERCRCDAVQHVVRQVQQEGGGWQGQQMQEIMQKARYLPRMCDVGPRECQIRAVFI